MENDDSNFQKSIPWYFDSADIYVYLFLRETNASQFDLNYFKIFLLFILCIHFHYFYVLIHSNVYSNQTSGRPSK